MNKALAVAIRTSCNQEQQFNTIQEACSIGYYLCLHYVKKISYDNSSLTYIYLTFYLPSYCSACHYLHGIAVTQELSFLLSKVCLLQDWPQECIILGFCIHNIFI